MTWQLVIVGLSVGALAGATGVGGGSLMTPILVLFLGFQPTVAIGTDLANGALFKTAAAWRHRRQGVVNLTVTVWLLIGSAPASLLGVATASWIHGKSDSHGVEARVLGAALLLGGLGYFLRTVIRSKEEERYGVRMDGRTKVIAVVAGAIGGFLVGLTSVGSGIFFALLMLTMFSMRPAAVVGTDLAHAAALLWVAGTGHVIAGNVDMHALGWLLLGSIPGSLIGASWTLHIPDRALRLGLAVILIASGIAVSEPPGAAPIAVTIAAVGVVLLALGTIQGGRFAPAPLRRFLIPTPAEPVASRDPDS
ncbi:MAG: sulfite exporter TauE/SafE family protein [Thermoleophilia bacterium]